MLKLSSTFILSTKLLVVRQTTVQTLTSNAFIYRPYTGVIRKYFPLLSGFTLAAYVGYKSIDAHCELTPENVENENTKTEKWTFYRYATCPFCCKVKTFLNYYDVDYEVVEVNPLMRKELKGLGSRKVPILKMDNNEVSM